MDAWSSWTGFADVSESSDHACHLFSQRMCNDLCPAPDQEDTDKVLQMLFPTNRRHGQDNQSICRQRDSNRPSDCHYGESQAVDISHSKATCFRTKVSIPSETCAFGDTWHRDLCPFGAEVSNLWERNQGNGQDCERQKLRMEPCGVCTLAHLPSSQPLFSDSICPSAQSLVASASAMSSVPFVTDGSGSQSADAEAMTDVVQVLLTEPSGVKRKAEEGEDEEIGECIGEATTVDFSHQQPQSLINS